MSINEIFSGREKYIAEVGEQLQQERTATVNVAGESMDIDYRLLSVDGKVDTDSDPVLVLPGFGSGWGGIAELGFSLACEGRAVVLPSLPGYGNSSNPSEAYYNAPHFDNEADAVAQFIDKILADGKKMHLAGHSMASEILAIVAQKHPDKIASLVLLNPAGVNEHEGAVSLPARFLLSGMHTNAEFKMKSFFAGEADYEKSLQQYLPKEESPFSKERVAQRLAEKEKLSHGHLLENLQKITVPITYISGELDTVYPPGSSDDPSSQLARVIESVQNHTQIEKSVMHGLRHNTTIAPDEITAANIDEYLRRAEVRNRQE